MLASSLRRHLAGVQALVAALDDAPVDPVEARELAELFARLEKLGCAGKASAAGKLEGTGAHGQRGCAEWLSAISGEPAASSRELLAATRQAARLPEVATAFRAGELSARQVAQIASASACDPGAASDLLGVARHGSYAELAARADTVRRLATGEARATAGDTRAHEERCLRVSRRPRGGVRGEFVLTDADWGRCLARLEAATAKIFAAALSTGTALAHDAAMADALVVLVCGSGGGCDPVRGVVRVDAAALRRGEALGGETCEVAGVGTVSVATARRLLGDSLLRVVVTEGTDVRTVTSPTRTVPASVRAALGERDQTCVVPGCDAAFGLEIDHWRTGFASGGPTCLENLARVCKVHHDMHTYGGWRLAGGPGRWQWIPPPRPPGPEEIAQARRKWSGRRGRADPVGRADHGPE